MSTESIERCLGRIEATQNLILKQLESHNNRLEDHIKEDREIARRVDKIEHTISKWSGIAVAVIFVSSFASDYILKILGLK